MKSAAECSELVSVCYKRIKLYYRQTLAHLRTDTEMCFFHNHFHYFVSPVYYWVQQFLSCYICVSKLLGGIIYVFQNIYSGIYVGIFRIWSLIITTVCKHIIYCHTYTKLNTIDLLYV